MSYLNKRDYKQVEIEDLMEGMELKTEVVNRYGNVLLPEGMVLQDIEKVKQLLDLHNIRSVRVKVDNSINTSFLDDLIRPDEYIDSDELEELQLNMEVENFKADLSEVKEELQANFEKILKGETVEQSEFQDNIKKILEIFKGSLNVFQLLERMKNYDDLTYAHSQNVALISYAIGKWLDLSQEQLTDLTLSGLLLDIGKMQVPVELLNKREKLTHDEILECQKHAIYGHQLIKNYSFVSEVVKQTVLLHHERMDGSGYPMGLKGDKIPLLARILAIADVYNALTSERPYREKKTPFNAIKIMEQEYVEKLDAKILYIFLQRIGNCFIGQTVELSNGSVGKIIFIPKQNLYRPIIQIKNSDTILDLSQPANKDIEIIDFK
ncbi:HD-GYP domain-containing protein [Alkaliphilus serpentinus]|uniref:HD-GYP domain-containing protein n=1 Tax=Alkaliphilus serpentinus TaxID=1482731 RepID=A0A833M844_9FIRM|nr:HD-GYP domain-containing protein [Alkaliphilus serpentinus]KAB3531822.1 HD-GYP domain-containing protein [Alkaliphilus serpentinus]